jgi:hypothetical protein
VSLQASAERVSAKVGFIDPASILTIFTTLIQLFQACRQQPVSGESPDEHEEFRQFLNRKYHNGRYRKLTFRQARKGVAEKRPELDRDQLDDLTAEILDEARTADDVTAAAASALPEAA